MPTPRRRSRVSYAQLAEPAANLCTFLKHHDVIWLAQHRLASQPFSFWSNLESCGQPSRRRHARPRPPLKDPAFLRSPPEGATAPECRVAGLDEGQPAAFRGLRGLAWGPWSLRGSDTRPALSSFGRGRLLRCAAVIHSLGSVSTAHGYLGLYKVGWCSGAPNEAGSSLSHPVLVEASGSATTAPRSPGLGSELGQCRGVVTEAGSVAVSCGDHHHVRLCGKSIVVVRSGPGPGQRNCAPTEAVLGPLLAVFVSRVLGSAILTPRATQGGRGQKEHKHAPTEPGNDAIACSFVRNVGLFVNRDQLGLKLTQHCTDRGLRRRRAW